MTTALTAHCRSTLLGLVNHASDRIAYDLVGLDLNALIVEVAEFAVATQKPTATTPATGLQEAVRKAGTET